MNSPAKSLIEIRKDLMDGNITCIELVQNYLKNIKDQKDLNVFISLFEDEALVRAGEIDEKIKAGKAGKLAGAVISIKDVINLRFKNAK